MIRKVNALIDPAVESSLHMIMIGFAGMIPSGMTNGFTAHDFRYILFGGSSFDVHDLMANTRFDDYYRHSPQIPWSENLLREMGPRDRQRFLRFCVSRYVPAANDKRYDRCHDYHKYCCPTA